MADAIKDSLQRVPLEELVLADVASLRSFLESPETAGVVDRLVAFRILAGHFPSEKRPATTDKTLPKDRYQRKGLEDLEDLRRRFGAPSEGPASFEAQEAALRREALRIAELWFGAEHDVTRSMAVYASLEASARAAVRAITDGGALSTDTRADLWRWLHSVEPRVQFLGGVSSIRPFLEFEANLRSQVVHFHKLLKAPHLGREVRLPLQEGYVDPRFRLLEAGNADVDDEAAVEVLSAAEVLSRVDRTVLLGDPGAGKSSFGGAVCYLVGRDYERRLVGGRLLTPMFIPLRDYAATIQDRTLVEHLASVARSRYQVAPPDGAIEYLVSEGRLLLVLDGLDEVLDVAGRQRVRDAVESFAHMYPMTHMLVTARFIGYEHATITGDEFQTLALEEFDDEQVAAYAHRWFTHQVDFSPDERERQEAGFLRDSSEHAADLRRNPLLLALLCAVYRGEGSLPRSRPAIYQRCVDLLLWQWDAMRQIRVDEPLGDHLERTLRHIAHWIYHDPDLVNGVPEDWLVSRCARFIAETHVGDSDDAAKIAVSFVNFCRDRAWVLVEVGHNEEGVALFAFAHRTFLEFFAAQHLEKRSRTPADIAAAILPLIGGAASVVPHLTLQLANTSRDDAGDEILRHLLASAEDADDAATRETILMFILESLQFVAPRPATVRTIARDIALGLIMPTLVDTTRYDGAPGVSPWPRIAPALAGVGMKNVRHAAVGFAEGMERATRDEDRRQAMELLKRGVLRQPEYLRSAWCAAYPELFDDHAQ